MKLIIEVNTQNIDEVVEARDLLNSYTLKSANSSVVEDVKIEKTTPTIPEEEKAAPEPEKKTRKRRTKAEIEAEKEKVVETAEDITLSDLKDIAQEKAKIDRKKVKDTISEYAGKLADVPEEKYAELAEKLKAL